MMLRVLIVEADEALTEIMAELLAREGSVVTLVGDIEEAVLRLDCYNVDIVILDPDTVSLSAEANTLAAWHTWLGACASPPRFVVVSVHAPSASNLPSSLIPGQEVQAGGSKTIWLRKPFRNEEFLSVVRSVARRNRVESEETESPEPDHGATVANLGRG